MPRAAGRAVEDLVADLFESRPRVLTRRDLRDLGPAGGLPPSWGALGEVEHPGTTACGSCGEDHPVELEFDPGAGSYRYYCGSVGFVRVPPEEVRAFRLDPGWLRDRLADGLGIGRPRHRELVPGVLWDLGDAALGGRAWSAFLARAVDLHLDAVLEALRTRGGKLPGHVLTACAGAPWSLALPHGHRLAPLRDVLEARADTLGVAPDMVLAALRGRRAGEPGRARGRPTSRATALDVFAGRLRDGLTLPGVGAEAAAIRDRLSEEYPELPATAVRTVENIIRAGHRARRGAQPRCTK